MQFWDERQRLRSCHREMLSHKNTVHITFGRAHIMLTISPRVLFVSSCCVCDSAAGTGVHSAGRRRRWSWKISQMDRFLYVTARMSDTFSASASDHTESLIILASNTTRVSSQPQQLCSRMSCVVLLSPHHLLFFVCRSCCQRNPQTLATGI